MARAKQLRLPEITPRVREKSAYGGSLRTTRAGRQGPRPLSTRETMHLVLKSSQARGENSFRRPHRDRMIRNFIAKFSTKYGVRVLSLANAGNHIHLHIRLTNRFAYNGFIRALTGAIALKMSQELRAAKAKHQPKAHSTRVVQTPLVLRSSAFWDHRPFTRIVRSFRAFVNLQDYVRVNAIEALGYSRKEARDLAITERLAFGSS